MKTFNVGALRQAIGELRLQEAGDLVQRTLARHGLVSPVPAAGFRPGFANPAARPAPRPAADAAPPGARLVGDRFACAAGSRDYLAYVPAPAAGEIRGMIVMLHGCTQTPDDFARGTGMNALAEEHRLVILYPHQSRGENAQSCWNWFSTGDQRRGRGEPEILAQMALALADRHDVPRERIFAAGLSAGAAMAVILGQTHPEVFAAIGAHSGLPFGAARDVPSAFAAMSGTDGSQPLAKRDARPTPTIVFHGSADRTVHPVNGQRIAAATLASGPEQTVHDRRDGRAGGRGFSREIATLADGRVLLEHWVVEGLGHAWSGGRPGGSYSDPQGPDASAEMVRFFLDRPA